MLDRPNHPNSLGSTAVSFAAECIPAEVLLELDLAAIKGGVIPGLVAKVKDFVSSDDTVAAFGLFEGTIVPSAIRVDTPVVDTPVAHSSSTTAGSFARFNSPIRTVPTESWGTFRMSPRTANLCLRALLPQSA
ncbi:hypothetical protein [Nevskia soli]|uniref:hypothetical protein n=1 Tax=Nevskia soli TaxID=418856 RepID=UPI0015D8BDE0|nr:hypothetical protein [Nevskia soli]